MPSTSTSRSRLLSILEAAEFLNISSWQVRRLVWRGDLPAVRIGRLVRLDREDLDAYITSQKCRNGCDAEHAISGTRIP
jgi:excisionase family DNA binding protein